jgi:RecA/RadA recombinase
MIVVDSVAALVKAEIEGEMDDPHMACRRA